MRAGVAPGMEDGVGLCSADPPPPPLNCLVGAEAVVGVGVAVGGPPARLGDALATGVPAAGPPAGEAVIGAAVPVGAAPKVGAADGVAIWVTVGVAVENVEPVGSGVAVFDASAGVVEMAGMKGGVTEGVGASVGVPGCATDVLLGPAPTGKLVGVDPSASTGRCGVDVATGTDVAGAASTTDAGVGNNAGAVGGDVAEGPADIGVAVRLGGRVVMGGDT